MSDAEARRHRARRDRRAAAIWSALPSCPWPARWQVEDGRSSYEYVIVLSQASRREVRIGREALVRPSGYIALEDLEGVGATVMVGHVSVMPGPRGLADAMEDAHRLALAHLVIES